MQRAWRRRVVLNRSALCASLIITVLTILLVSKCYSHVRCVTPNTDDLLHKNRRLVLITEAEKQQQPNLHSLPTWASGVPKVQHMWLPGTLQHINTTVAGVLHVWLRAYTTAASKADALEVKSSIMLKGFAYFWAPSASQQVRYKFQQVTAVASLPALSVECGLADALQGAGYTQQYNMTTQAMGQDAQYNIYLQGNLPALSNISATSSCVLRVNGWSSAWPLGTALQHPSALPDAGQPLIKGAVTVLGTFYHDLPIDWVVRMWEVHCDMYRNVLGFSGTLWYIKSLSQPLRQAIMQTACASSGTQHTTASWHLHFQLWEELPMFLGTQRGLFINEHEKYEQNIAHNHALLALAWSGYAAFVTDLDEVLASPGPPSAILGADMKGPFWKHLLQQCLPGSVETAASVLWLTCVDAILPVQQALQTALPEIMTWNASGRQALLAYRHISSTMPYHKGFVLRPEAVAQYVVHVGTTVTQLGLRLEPQQATGDDTMVIQETCMHCIHLRNMLQKRRMDMASFRQNTSWHWMLT